MEDISNNIQKLRDQIVHLEMDKRILLEKNLNGENDIDISVVDNEIMELETKLEKTP